MTGVIATIPRIQFSGPLGVPLIGGKLHTYLAGTTTPEPTFQDEALTIANANPIELDSTGSCTLWLDPAKSYKFLLKNALGVTQPGWPVDKISGAAPGSLLTGLGGKQGAAQIGGTWFGGVEANVAALGGNNGAALVGFVRDEIGAIAQSLQSKNREQLSVRDFGVLPGVEHASANCAAYARLATAVNARGGNVTILWPPARETYHFSPRTNSAFNTSTAYAWRNAVELVDVKDVYHLVAGAHIHIDADPAWTRANPLPVNSCLDESVFQFRSSAAGLCARVGVIGPGRITTNRTVASAEATDGTCMGVAFRGCTDTVLADMTAENWGTDSFYYGTGYGNAFGGERHIIVNPVSIAAYRQGISIVRNSHGTIIGGNIRQTSGGSFGHAIDWEPDGAYTQQDWTVIGLRTSGNERGAVNFINTQSVYFYGCQFDEKHPDAAGCIYIDGSNVVGFDVSDIRFIGCRLESLEPVLYVTGSPAAGGGIDDIRFTSCRLSTVGDNPSSAAFIRVNPNGYTSRRIGRITFDGCTIYGNGGITMRGDGTNEARIELINRTAWALRNPAGSTLKFTFSTAGTFVDMDGVVLSVEPGQQMATASPFIQSGRLVNCRLTGQPTAKIEWVDYGAGRTKFEIGWNDFSEHNYYKGVVSALTLTFPSSVVSARVPGDYGIACRVVHGGRRRVDAYLSTPALFVDGQAPRDGDITYNVGNAAASVVVTSYTYNAHLAAWRQSGFITRSGTQFGRPAVGAADVGVQYLDTSLAANGKLITWNGNAWVDATGATV